MKLHSIVPGGDTGQDSIHNGLVEAERLFPLDSCVLIHDGVHPLITEQTISDNIEAVRSIWLVYLLHPCYRDIRGLQIGWRFGDTFS